MGKTRRTGKEYFKMRSGKEKGNIQIEVFPQIMKDLRYRTFKEVKKIALIGDRSLQWSLRSENSMMMMSNLEIRTFIHYIYQSF